MLAAELLEHETLTRKDLDRILADVKKRPRITTFNDFGDRVPSDKPPIKTPAELAAERGEPWPPEPPSLTKPAHQHPQYPGQGEVPAPPRLPAGAQPQYQPANGYPQPQTQAQPQPQSQPVPASEPLPGFQPAAPYRVVHGTRRARLRRSRRMVGSGCRRASRPRRNSRGTGRRAPDNRRVTGIRRDLRVRTPRATDNPATDRPRKRRVSGVRRSRRTPTVRRTPATTVREMRTAGRTTWETRNRAMVTALPSLLPHNGGKARPAGTDPCR